MNENSKESECTASDQESSVTSSHSNHLYRLRRYCHCKLPSLFKNPDIKEELRQRREGDEEDNTKTEPPPDELIDLPCIWAVEFYTPSHFSQLLRGLQKLEWDKDEHVIGGRNPTLWIQRCREKAGGRGIFKFGHIYPPDKVRFPFAFRKAPLPLNVDFATATMYSMTSSISCIVIGFVLDNNFSRLFGKTLRLRRQTVFKPTSATGYRILPPSLQKKEDIRAIHHEIQTSVAKWFCNHLPGIFASGLMDDEFPTFEFVTLRQTQPFPKEGEEHHEALEWLSMMDMASDYFVWQSKDLPGLKLGPLSTFDGKGKFHFLIAAKENVFADKNLRKYGDGRSSYVSIVDTHFSYTFSCFALLHMLDGFERHLNNIRDSITLDTENKKKPLNLLKWFGDHVRKGMDIQTVSVELQQFTKHRQNHIEIFTPPNLYSCHNKNITFEYDFLKRIEKHSLWLEKLNLIVKDFLIQYSSILGTYENIKLQKSMGCLTWVIVALTIIMAVIGILTFYLTPSIKNELQELLKLIN